MKNFRFAVIGHPEPGEMENLESLAAELGIRDVLHFEDARGDIPEVMASLDMLVVPCYKEAFGLVTVEGMLAGIPVIGGDGAPCPRLSNTG
jgi:UDP-glucose:(heptosyl)LPS alpha-1,3-glucosyltransferase